MYKNTLLLFFLILGITAAAQHYPEVILPNSSKTFESKEDTLWVLKNSQMDNAIIAAKSLAAEEEINDTLRSKISVMLKKDIEKDSLISIITRDRDFYMNNWKVCTADIDPLLRQNKRQKLFARLGYVGIVAAFIAGILIGK